MFQVNLALMNGEESRQKWTVKTKVLQFMFQFFLLSSILCFCVHTRWLNKSMGFLYWSVYSKRYSPDFHIVLHVVFYLVWQKGLKKRGGGVGSWAPQDRKLRPWSGFLTSQQVNKSYLTTMGRSSGIKFSLVSQQSFTEHQFLWMVLFFILTTAPYHSLTCIIKR